MTVVRWACALLLPTALCVACAVCAVDFLPAPPAADKVNAAPQAAQREDGTLGLVVGTLVPQVYMSDKNVRMEQLLYQSEDLRQMHDEWRRFWMEQKKHDPRD